MEKTIYLNLDQVDLALKLIEEEINKEQEVASTNILLARAQSEIIKGNYNKALIDLKLSKLSSDKKQSQDQVSFQLRFIHNLIKKILLNLLFKNT